MARKTLAAVSPWEFHLDRGATTQSANAPAKAETPQQAPPGDPIDAAIPTTSLRT